MDARRTPSDDAAGVAPGGDESVPTLRQDRSERAFEAPWRRSYGHNI